jgi:hypothetical protein
MADRFARAAAVRAATEAAHQRLEPPATAVKDRLREAEAAEAALVKAVKPVTAVRAETASWSSSSFFLTNGVHYVWWRRIIRR